MIGGYYHYNKGFLKVNESTESVLKNNYSKRAEKI